MRDFAGLLVAHDAREAGISGAPPGSFSVPEKLRPHLTTLMGDGGYRALLLRSLVMAIPEVPPLQATHVSADGRLEGFDSLETGIDPEAIVEGRVIVVAQLIGLLVAFIGEKLTLQLVREVWPKLDTEDLNLKKGDRI
jgi:hypothetical protein